MPANELLTFVCAIGNKNIGTKFPRAPATINQESVLRSIFFKAGKPIHIKIIPDTITLIAPTWYGEKASKDFLIKIKELPHVIDKRIRIDHLFLKNFIKD